MSEPLVLVEADGPVLIVTINRPEKKNAANAEVLCRLYDAWVRLDEDDDLRVAILTGRGDTFCAGMDLKEIGRLQSGVVDNEWLGRFRDQPGESAVFGVTEVQRGLFPMAGSAVRLRRQIGYAVAAEMLLTGEDLPARRALELGLINHVVPDGQALAKAREIADRIARNGPLAVKAIVATLRETETLPEEEAFGIEMGHGGTVMMSNDAREGPRAFLEKRDPVFTGT